MLHVTGNSTRVPPSYALSLLHYFTFFPVSPSVKSLPFTPQLVIVLPLRSYGHEEREDKTRAIETLWWAGSRKWRRIGRLDGKSRVGAEGPIYIYTHRRRSETSWPSTAAHGTDPKRSEFSIRYLQSSAQFSTYMMKPEEKIDKHDNACKELAAMENTHELSSDASKASKHSGGTSGLGNGSAYKEKENVKSSSQINGDLSIIGDKLSRKPGSITKLSLKDEARCGVSGRTKINKKCTIARISETHSISVDFRISRGIAQKCMEKNRLYPEALIGRGTAYAFQRELENAIIDFTKAIESNPAACEAWKRRGKARAALGEFAEAVEDLTQALVLEPKSPDILHERGIINFKSKDFTAAIKDLSTFLKQEKYNKSAYSYVHYQELADHHKALECIEQALQVDNRVWKAYHLRGLVFHGLGEHRYAQLNDLFGLSIENSIECLYLRGSCYHAVGEYRDAVDYDATVEVELDAVEKFVLQCLAFYQKDKLKKQDLAITKPKANLLRFTDLIGKKIQYGSPGFLPNRRQGKAWALCNAYCGENYGSTDLDTLGTVRDAILRNDILLNMLAYMSLQTLRRYNFMPLARGTAVTGFIVLLGLLLAANMFTESIPKGLQMDWEALLNVEPGFFVGSVIPFPENLHVVERSPGSFPGLFNNRVGCGRA
ncbi:hypothetical protein Bca52824_091803 [Brassica carinata]|uniref:Uncharacterized protein n=1 Tax=Brassica carinata TaxID=52824 RepID=A0A8X7TF44_BRACI|nr:hypothetical protein Bca52824_091803 [Brassica carinata]